MSIIKQMRGHRIIDIALEKDSVTIELDNGNTYRVYSYSDYVLFENVYLGIEEV